MNFCFFDLEKLGEERELANYYYADKLFSDEEIDKIKNLGDSLSSNMATTFGGDKEADRKGQVAWLPRSEDNLWIYGRLFQIVKEANDNLWNFKILGFMEDCQYTTYIGSKEKGDHYNYHLDLDGSEGVHRKISLVVQLTDEKEYEGGELELRPRCEGIIASKQKGTATIFPSYILHKVHPVTKGKRNSLVVWLSGYPFE